MHQISGPDVTIKARDKPKNVAAFFSDNPPLVRLADGSQLSGNILLKHREQLGETFDRDHIQTLDWSGIDLSKESRWKDGKIRNESIQQRFVQHLEEGGAQFIVDDDDQGESADIVAIEEIENTITVYLWHCKYSSGSEPGRRVGDLYEVCGQAQKSVKWTWNFNTFIKHLTIRESKYYRGRESRFIRGSVHELVTLRKGARRKFIKYKIGVVQPGLSKAQIPNDHLAIIGSTNSLIQIMTDSPLLVYGSE